MPIWTEQDEWRQRETENQYAIVKVGRHWVATCKLCGAHYQYIVSHFTKESLEGHLRRRPCRHPK